MLIALRVVSGILSLAVCAFFVYGLVLSDAFGGFGADSASMSKISAFFVCSMWILTILGLAGFAIFGPKNKGNKNQSQGDLPLTDE